LNTTPHHQVERRIRAALTELSQDVASVQQSLMRDDDPNLDSRLTGVYYRAAACRRFLTLYRPPRHATFEPAATLRNVSGQQMPPSAKASTDSPMTAHGDEEQVGECARLVVESVRMLVGGGMQFALFEGDDELHIAFRVSEGGKFPEKLFLGKMFDIPMREFMERWAAATEGGEPIPEPVDKFGHALTPLARAVRRLRPWGGAAGYHEDGLVSPEETRKLYNDTVQRVQDAIDESLRAVG